MSSKLRIRELSAVIPTVMLRLDAGSKAIMVDQSRKSVETRIRQLSQQLDTELFVQQQRSEAKKLNFSILEAMLFEWHKLAELYKQSLYAYQSIKPPDLEMSLFIVKNYLEWREALQIYMTGAVRSGDQQYAEELDEALNTLEYEMREILKATIDHDEYQV